jgi:hypothetical protein
MDPSYVGRQGSCPKQKVRKCNGAARAVGWCARTSIDSPARVYLISSVLQRLVTRRCVSHGNIRTIGRTRYRHDQRRGSRSALSTTAVGTATALSRLSFSRDHDAGYEYDHENPKQPKRSPLFVLPIFVVVSYFLWTIIQAPRSKREHRRTGTLRTEKRRLRKM